MANLKLKVKKAKMIRKVNNVNVTGYYGRVVSNGKTSFDEIARNSTRNTTLHPSEAELAAKMLLEGVCEQIKQGMIVDLGPLGTLYPAVSGSWKESADDLSLSEMTPKVTYKASADIEGAVKSASLGWASESATTTSADDTTGGEVADDTNTGGDSSDPSQDLEG